MQKITLKKALTYPWDNALLYSTPPHPFLFREMGLYGIYGSHLLAPTEVLGKAIHHPDAELELMNMMNRTK